MRTTFALIAALILLLEPSLFAQAPPGADGTVLEEHPYTLPYPSIESWLKAIHNRDPQFGPERQAFMRSLFGPSFDRVRRGIVVITRLTYASDRNRVVAYLLRPQTKQAGRRPAVIYNRGGNREFGALDMPDLLDLTGLAAHGYVVIASQYRGNDGGTGKEEFGGG